MCRIMPVTTRPLVDDAYAGGIVVDSCSNHFTEPTPVSTGIELEGCPADRAVIPVLDSKH